MTEQEYSKFVWDNADQTQMYKDILNDLITDWENPYKAEIIRAKDENDYARMVIWTNFLWKYIVQLVNDMVNYIWEKEGWEESINKYLSEIGLSETQNPDFKTYK